MSALKSKVKLLPREPVSDKAGLCLWDLYNNHKEFDRELYRFFAPLSDHEKEILYKELNSYAPIEFLIDDTIRFGVHKGELEQDVEFIIDGEVVKTMYGFKLNDALEGRYSW